MNVTEAARRRTHAELPADAARPFEVYVNGVAQREGVDFTVRGRTLVFDRELRHEGRLGFWRWASMVIGVAGTYRQNDTVDVVYTRGGGRSVASGLPLEPESSGRGAPQAPPEQREQQAGQHRSSGSR